MPYTPTLFANTILNEAFARKVEITPMKLQKMMYFMAAEYAHNTGTSLFTERFETWRFGPVLRTVYEEFRSFGSKPITKFAKDAFGKSYMVTIGTDFGLASAFNTVWDATQRWTGWDLSMLTHKEGSAWYKADKAREPFISSEFIQDDFTYRKALGIDG